MNRPPNTLLALGFSLVLMTGTLMARAAIINLTTNDDYSKIERANPGDQVVIAPGTYSFRVFLTKQSFYCESHCHYGT